MSKMCMMGKLSMLSMISTLSMLSMISTMSMMNTLIGLVQGSRYNTMLTQCPRAHRERHFVRSSLHALRQIARALRLCTCTAG